MMAILLIMGFMAGCSSHIAIYPKLEALGRQGAYPEAVQFIQAKKSDYGERNRVLYHLDLGMMLHLAGRYADSNQELLAAERDMRALYTESISANVGAFLTNDNLLAYAGEDHEQVLVNLYLALNYAALGKLEDALVEARKVDDKLADINRHYDSDKTNVYREDAFARVLMGSLREASGSRDDINDAYIDNRKALGIYQKLYGPTFGQPAPHLLGENLLATSAFMGGQEKAEAQKAFPDLQTPDLSKRRASGQIFLVHSSGLGPIKVEERIQVRTGQGDTISLAFPRYQSRRYRVDGSRLVVDGQVVATTQSAEPVGEIAKKTLENKRGRIMVKAVARATTKYLANKALQQKLKDQYGDGGQLAGMFIGNAAANLSEQADLRAWETLPDQVLVGRAILPAGAHQVTVEFLSAGSVVRSVPLGDMNLAPGAVRFVSVRSWD